MRQIFVGEERACRKLVTHFMLHYSTKTTPRKGFDPELYESKFISLRIVFGTECVACLHRRNEKGNFFLATDSKYAVFFRCEKDGKGISKVLQIYHNVRIICYIGA